MKRGPFVAAAVFAGVLIAASAITWAIMADGWFRASPEYDIALTTLVQWGALGCDDGREHDTADKIALVRKRQAVLAQWVDATPMPPAAAYAYRFWLDYGRRECDESEARLGQFASFPLPPASLKP